MRITSIVRRVAPALALGGLFTIDTGTCQAQDDTPPPPITSLVVGDLDGDGAPDLVASIANARRLSVLRNDRNSSFSARRAGPTEPGIIVAADLDGDRLVDLAVAERTTGRVAIMLNQGDGTFDVTNLEPGGTGAPACLVAADVDGDRDTDLLMGWREGESIAILTNAGDGTFASGKDHAIGATPNHLAVADLDGDTDLDLVVASATGESLAIGLNDGGSLGEIEQIWGGVAVRFVVAADVDGDEDVDLVVAHDEVYSDTVTILINDGTATFEEAGAIAAGAVAELHLGDLDLDGDLDAVAVEASPGGFSPGAVSVAMSAGDGTFGAPVVYSLPPGGVSAGLSDLDRDGRLDVAVAIDEPADLAGDGMTWTPGHVVVLRNIGAGGLASPVSFEIGDQPTAIVLRDVDENSNGLPEIIMADPDGDAITIWPNRGAGRFGNFDRHPVGDWPAALAVIDNPPDIITVNINDDTFARLPYRSGGTYAAAEIYGLGDRPGSLLLPEHSASVFAANLQDGTLSYVEAYGTGRYKDQEVWPIGSYPAMLARGSLDDDGAPEVVAPNMSEDLFTVLLNRGMTFRHKLSYETGPAPGALALADLNSLAGLDVVVTNRGESRIDVFQDLTDGVWQKTHNYFVEDGPWAVRTEDLDGDGDVDVVTANRGADSITVLLNRGDGLLEAAEAYDVAKQPTRIEVTDLDADGFRDLVVMSDGSDEVSILFGLEGGRFSVATYYDTGLSPRALIVGDVDGDGDPDLVLANRESDEAVFSVMLNVGDGRLQAPLLYEMTP